jgi:ribosomal RNA-processing protein 12
VNEGSNPMNLLDASASSTLMRSAVGKRQPPEQALGGSDFERNAAGKFVFREEEKDGGKHEGDDPLNSSRRKRRRADASGMDSDDSEFEDMRGVAGLPAALKGTRGAHSLKGASKYANSHASGSTAKSKASRATDPGQHSGAKFKAKKASGDKKGNSKVEPYAYVRFDRNLLNPRAGRSQGAKSQLASMVNTGVLRGNKVKRARKSA